MKYKFTRKNRLKKFKIGSGYHDEFYNNNDIENQLENVRYEVTPDIENQIHNKNYISKNKDKFIKNLDKVKFIDIDKPKNVLEIVPVQKESFIEPMENDIEINIPSDDRIDLGNSGYGIYDNQFYGGITKNLIKRKSTKKGRASIKRINKKNKSKSKSKSNSNKSKSKSNKYV
jgi:hypothetical protein